MKSFRRKRYEHAGGSHPRRDCLKRLSVYLSIVCISLALVSVPACGQAEAPVWTTGDFWEYGATVRHGGIWVDFTMKVEVIGDDQISVGGTTYDCYSMVTTLEMSAQGSTVTVATKHWARKSDLADVRMEGTIEGGEIAMTYSPPLAVVWPLDVGHTWSGSSTVTTESSIGGETTETWEYSAEVKSLTSITVPAGTFETYEFHTTIVGIAYAELNFAPDVGHHARIRNAQVLGFDEPIELVDYRFQAGPEITDAWGVEVLWFAFIFAAIIIVVIVILCLYIQWKSIRSIEMPFPRPPEPPGQW